MNKHVVKFLPSLKFGAIWWYCPFFYEFDQAFLDSTNESIFSLPNSINEDPEGAFRERSKSGFVILGTGKVIGSHSISEDYIRENAVSNYNQPRVGYWLR